MPGSIIAAEIFGIMLSGTTAYMVTAFAINLVASMIISKAFAPNIDNQSINAENPGSRLQVSPAGDNKLPILYGSAYLGGIVTDLSITTNNQVLYYVLSIAEVTNTETGGTPDSYTFGDIYFGGKKCIFDVSDTSLVVGLLDESTGITDNTVNGLMNFYLYRNGSYSGVNTATSAIQIMQDANLVYKWDATKLMSNCAFAIIKITYNQNANLTGLQQTKFQITSPRTQPGDCFVDYLTSTRYGAAIPLANLNIASFTALNTYCNGSFPYTTSSGISASQTRFKFDGTLDTDQNIMNNLQLMASSCDCLIRFNEITGTWGVIVQSPTYTVAMDLNDSNVISSMQISPTDIASAYNIAEVKFPDGTSQDAFNTATYNLAVINPALMYPNEPVNKQSINLPLVNNGVRAQYLANRFLKAGREDLQIQLSISYIGLQLEAGDIVTLTNVNYGWTSKLFRISKVVENFNDDGSITATLSLMEYNAAVYDDISITQFTPAPNTGIGSPLAFGALTAPSIVNLQPSITNPSFGVLVTAAASGITQYAEVYYSAFSNPTSTQRIFAGTTSINPNGSPFTPSASMGTVTLSNIPSGDWYFSVCMVNGLGKSAFSASSSILRWRPTTFQYVERYAVIAYGNDLSGAGLTALPTGKSYYGIYNSASSNFSTLASDYTWFLADPNFGTSNYLLFTNRQGRKFSFASGQAAYSAGTARFVPTQTSIYDPSIWSALPSGLNFIDLDVRTGQLTETGTTSIGSGEIAITNNANGKVVASLSPLLDFGAGVQTLTGTAATLTIDIYGRVLGFVTPDSFYYTRFDAVATTGQTVFTPTARQANYITGMDLVFRNGALLDTADYTENSTTVTLGVGATTGDVIVILSMRAISSGISYIAFNSIVQSVASNVVTYTLTSLPYQTIVAGDVHTFLNTGTPTQYTVSSWNAATREVTYTATVTGVAAGAIFYQYRTSGLSYRPFSRWTTTLTAATTYTPTTFTINSGYEKLFLNGTSVNDQDYDLVTGAVTNFPATTTGLLTIIQFSDAITTTPIGNQLSVSTNTIISQPNYNFNLDQNAFELYNNGSLQIVISDYITGTGSYSLTTAPTTNLNILQQTTYNRTGAA
tara:strand:- start:12361 stop:15678 length:3318 start_codon:yes stop_codon:yes gene_type:complete